MLFRDFDGAPPPAPPPGAPGTVGWHELHADDGAKAFSFYSDFFGWNKEGEFDMGPIGVYHLFNTRHGEHGGIMTRMPQTPMSFWLYYFNFEGADVAAERITAGGGRIINGPHEVRRRAMDRAGHPAGRDVRGGGAEAVTRPTAAITAVGLASRGASTSAGDAIAA